MSGAAAAFGITIGDVIENPVTWKIAQHLANEAYTVGKAKGVHFSFDDPVQYVKDFGSKMPKAKPSMLLDLQDQRVTEVDAINGMVPIVAEQVGLSAPYNEAVTAMIKAKESLFA
jgi:2-dehydropantoate 2-reductase